MIISAPDILTLRSAPQTRELTVCTLQVRAGTINEQERSIEAVLSTENPVQVLDMRTWQIIDEVLLARGAQFNSQVVLLDNHSRWSNEDVLGSIRSIGEENGKIVGRLHFAAGDERADRIWNKVRQGHITDVSIGYRSIDFVDIPPGTSQRVAGKEYRATTRTLRVTTRYQIREGSVTPIGADQAAKMRAELPQSTPRKEITMSLALRQYLESIGLRGDASDSEAWTFYNRLHGAQRERAGGILEGRIVPAGTERTDPPANPPAPPTEPPVGQRNDPPANPPAPPAAPPANPVPSQRTDTDEVRIRREAAEAERTRIEGIRGLATQETRGEWIDHCIRQNHTVEQAGHYILTQERAMRQPAVSGAPAGHVRDRDQDNTRMAMAGALMMRTGIDPMILARNDAERAQWEQHMNRGDDLPLYSLFDFCREAVRIHGARDPHDGSVPHSQEGFIRAAMSTPTLAYVFTTSVNARLLGAYDEAADTTDFVEVVDVPDFKQNEVIALGKQPGLELLARGQTAKDTTYADEQETYRVKRFARKFTIDDQDIIDNNLDGFSSVLPEMGLRAASLRPDMVYYMLIANPTLAADSVVVFHSGHANTDTNALSSANLKTGVSKMRLQQQNGVNLNINPAFLIAAPTLEWTGKELINSSQIIIAGTAGSVTERGNENVLRDLNLQLRIDARLENGVTDPITGTAAAGAATKWFLASRPFRTIRVAYRQGTGRKPQIRRYVLDKGQWGMGWDINLDIGAAMLGYRGLYRGNT